MSAQKGQVSCFLVSNVPRRMEIFVLKYLPFMLWIMYERVIFFQSRVSWFLKVVGVGLGSWPSV